jgi:hypothetical protein
MGTTAAYARISVAGNPGHTDLAVVDLRTPSAPTIVSQTYLPGGSGAAVAGSLLYVAAGSGGLKIYDIATPLSPRLLGTALLTNGANVVAVSNGYAYVSSGAAIVVVDARTPAAPLVAGTYPATVLGLAASGGRLYAVNSTQLIILNVATPTQPVLLSTSPGYGAQGVAVWGTYALLGAPADPLHPENHGLYVVNVATPTSPSFVEEVVLAGNSRSVVVLNNYAYVGDSASVADVIALQ